MNKSKKELGFWSAVAKACAPGWNIELGKGGKTHAQPISCTNCYVYGIEVATGWCLMGGFAVEELDVASRYVGSRFGMEGSEDLATKHISTCSAKGEGVSLLDKEEAVSHLAAAVRNSAQFEAIRRANGSGRGHWVYLIYTMQDGSMMGEAAYLGGAELNRPKSMTELLADAARVMSGRVESAIGGLGEVAGAGCAMKVSQTIRSAMAGQ